MDESLHRRLKITCVNKNITIAQFMSLLFEVYISETPAGEIIRKKVSEKIEQISENA